MNPRLALRMVRAAARDSARVYFTAHARAQMRQRRITRLQVIECLLRGQITEGPAPDVRGGWRCRVERFVAGDEVAVAVAIDQEAGIVVITVFETR